MYPYFCKMETSQQNVRATNFEKSTSHYTVGNQEEFEKYVLDIILEAIEQEYQDMRYYEELSNTVRNQEHKQILRRIHLDDMKHFKMLCELYSNLAEKEPRFEYNEINIDIPLANAFLEGCESKHENVELYRNIMVTFLDVEIRDMLFEIITDEQNHAQKLSNLYCEYR